MVWGFEAVVFKVQGSKILGLRAYYCFAFGGLEFLGHRV